MEHHFEDGMEEPVIKEVGGFQTNEKVLVPGEGECRIVDFKEDTGEVLLRHEGDTDEVFSRKIEDLRKAG